MAITSITVPPTIKNELQWFHNVKVNSAEVRRNVDMARIIKDIAALCDVEFEGDNVMEEKIIPRNGWRLSIAILPSQVTTSDDIKALHDTIHMSMLAAFMVYRIDGSKREMHIGQMAVVPSYRGMGVGGVAIRLLKDMAKSDKCPVDKVVCSSLPKAIRFYKKNGFRKIHKGENGNYKVGDDVWVTRDDELMFELAKIEAVNDISHLPLVNEPIVNDVIKRRYLADLIYTAARPMLIAVNPFRDLNNTTSDIAQYYRRLSSSSSHVESHMVNGVLEACNGNVSILVSGESGAGKTETCKHLMKFFTEQPGSATTTTTSLEEDSSSLCNALMAFNPILEAFGNAKTSRNDNSSRFGKLVKLYLSQHPVVAGGQVLSFLLEKSRICLHEEGERNYHIFYQLLRGGGSEILGRLGLNPQKESYKVLNGILPIIPGIDDGGEYQVTMNAMITLGIHDTKRLDICRVLAAILHSGQIEWQQAHDHTSKDNESNPCMPSDENRFILIAELLGLPFEDFLKALTVQTRRLPGNNVVLSPVSPQQCSDNLASISRHCYSIVFEWLIYNINSSISPHKDTMQEWVSVLDIFGFESFEHRNSLEQFLVNFANERLQLCFTQRVFELEKKGLSGDSLASEVINYAPVEPLLRVLQGPSYGCISHIESACLLQTGTDQSIMNAFSKANYPLQLFTTGIMQQQQQKAKGTVSKKDNPADIFIIHHTAGSVVYNINGFRDKNMDRLNDDLHTLISHTTNGTH
ncbi:myosin B, putative [Perkinsus marinus ATCC 50983]|uniref:Myosin B, putative n=1 Tax=Perkinsus marinus (strain ATCC 50983 / TXsc) TaxID=423536 RepID=C5KTR0_PERM5|nr:myosin B, putative [Perkinsus marinus ATCC 50983]EER11952.1 myosin B, putative [Perkinsus marinus ATCC 50983]|eukprot:XP_002780157.1 myosin B, putative [Perkinsus marinus ATCC 50983]